MDSLEICENLYYVGKLLSQQIGQALLGLYLLYHRFTNNFQEARVIVQEVRLFALGLRLRVDFDFYHFC